MCAFLCEFRALRGEKSLHKKDFPVQLQKLCHIRPIPTISTPIKWHNYKIYWHKSRQYPLCISASSQLCAKQFH